jgi:hypothetical protein
MVDPVISVCIPVYKEPEIHITVGRLLMQKCRWPFEIVLAEYIPDGVSCVHRANYGTPFVKYVRVDGPGIAYARHKAIEMAKGKVVVNFDADSYFSHHNALELLVAPILNKEAVLCVCDNAFNRDEIKTPEEVEAMKLPQSILDFLNSTQRTMPLLAFLECGSAMEKEAYMFVGGFRDVKMWELFNLSPIMLWQFPGMKRWVDGVVAITSARRALASARYGTKALDYGVAYRPGGPVSVT